MNELKQDIGGLFQRLKGNRENLDKHCPVCGEPLYLECTIEGRSGKEKCIVPRQCACRRAESEKAAAQSRRSDIEIARERALPNAAARQCRFESSDMSRELNAVKEYAEKWRDGVNASGIGLMLWGGVGTGKTHAAYCLANALIDSGVSVYMTSISQLADTTFQDTEDRVYAMNRVKGCGLLILDDVGAERETSFMNEKAFTFIDARVSTGKPLIVTTNVAPQDMKNSTDISKRRIYDRIQGATVPIAFNGASKRMAKVDSNAAALRAILRG